MSKTGKYIYGIINSNGKRSFGPWGITALEDVYTIPYQNISAVISDSEIVDYAYLLKDMVARYFLRHQQTIEKIMVPYTIIPMRLGTFANNNEEVREILTNGYRTIKNIFERIKNSIEIDVIATWSDFNLVLKEVAEEEEIREFKQTLLNKKEGVTVDAQVKIGGLVKNYLDKIRERYANEIQISLNKITKDSKTHGLLGDKMVFNAAFLIDKGIQKDFEKEVETLNTKFTEKLNFRCVGPLPPYSFYTLEVKKMQFKEIDWARKKFGLSDFTSKDEIKKTYKRLAFSFHPDKNPNIPGIENKFNEITKAYRILWEYCEGESCSFNEGEFKKNAISVKVRD